MKNITEILNEAYSYSDDWMKAVSNKLNMIGADEFNVVCDIVLDWLEHPNKSADFYKGDGGQSVNDAAPKIKKWAEATKDAIDDELIL